MTYVIPDRQAVAQMKYQLRRFRKQCADLPESTQILIAEAMVPLAELLAAIDEEDTPEGY